MSARESQICTVPTAIIRLFALAKIDPALYKGG
ncbi:hypothetical protein M728_005373 (plasmid) [Ensifer sp. WSM1721]